MNFHAGDSVFRGVKISGPAKHFGGDAVFADLRVASGEMLLTDVIEQLYQALRAGKSGGSEHRRELRTFRAGDFGDTTRTGIQLRHLLELYTLPRFEWADGQVLNRQIREISIL